MAWPQQQQPWMVPGQPVPPWLPQTMPYPQPPFQPPPPPPLPVQPPPPPAAAVGHFIASPTWTECKRGYAFTNGVLGVGYYKDDTLVDSEVHQAAADASEAAAAAAALKAAADAKAAAAEAAAREAELEHARIEASLAEKAPLEALAARYAMEHEKQKRAKEAEQAEKIQRALMIEAGYQFEPEALLENNAAVEPADNDDEDEAGENAGVGDEGAEAEARAAKVAEWEKFNASRAAASEGENVGEALPPLGFEEWEEITKLAKKQEWWAKENQRRASESLEPLTFEAWEELEAEKRKEKKRAKARERGKHGEAVPELSGLELAIVPGQMWATDKTGIPDHLPAAVKQKIMKKLMNEVIMRPSPEQEERLRIEALEKEKAARVQSEDYKVQVLRALDKAVAHLEAVASKLPAVQRRKRDAERLQQAQVQASATTASLGEPASGGDGAAAASDPNGAEPTADAGAPDPNSPPSSSSSSAGAGEDGAAPSAPPSEPAGAASGPIVLGDEAWDEPRVEDAVRARQYQAACQNNARTQAMQAQNLINPAAAMNPVLGMFAANQAAAALVTATPEDRAKFTALGKEAATKLAAEKKRLKAGGAEDKDDDEEDEDDDDARDEDDERRDRKKRDRKHAKSSSSHKHHRRRSRSRSGSPPSSSRRRSDRSRSRSPKRSGGGGGGSSRRGDYRDSRDSRYRR